jgi:transposase
MTDDAVRRLSPRFESLYATTGRPSIPPEHLLRALLLQVLYSVRSERMLMEQLEYNLLFRWFCRPRHRRSRVGADHVHQESRSPAR